MTRDHRKLHVWIRYIVLVCVTCMPHVTPSIHAQHCQAIIIDQEECQRTKTATIVAGTTVFALLAGAAVVACCCSGSKNCSDSHHHHHHDSYNNHHHHHHRHHHHRHSSRCSNDCCFYSSSNVLDKHSANDPQFLERPFPDEQIIRSRSLTHLKKNKQSRQIAGMFKTHLIPSRSAKGQATAFVQLPDGTTESLGKLSLSNTSPSSISFGPYTQKGDYTFGIRLEDNIQLPSSSKIASVEVSLNGLTVESRDFFIPAQAPARYEPMPLHNSF